MGKVWQSDAGKRAWRLPRSFCYRCRARVCCGIGCARIHDHLKPFDAEKQQGTEQQPLDWLTRLIGSDADTILWWQMAIRGVLIFFYTLMLVRFGGRRIFGKNTSFDIVLGVILGSIMSRALTANAQFLPTLVAGTVLVVLHWLLAKLATRNRHLGHLIKGTEVLLIKDGQIQQDGLTKTNITEHDLLESLRSEGSVAEIEQVKRAYLERNGKVSVIT